MRFHQSALIAVTSLPAALAFAPTGRRSSFTTVSTARHVATNPELLNSATDTASSMADVLMGGNNKSNGNKSGGFDMEGIALSSLKGKALGLNPEDFPGAAEIRAVIPQDCFEPDTSRSLGYLSVSLIGTIICSAIGFNLIEVIPANFWTTPFWAAYSAVTGTVAMGLWVLAHECGHGAFSKNKKLQDAVGYIIHSIMLVPYYSWQRSHAVHHQYTNHMDLGETHVPEGVPDKTVDDGSLKKRNWFIKEFGEEKGLAGWGVVQLFLHLVAGWPAYLLIGATGGPARGMTNHFYPSPLTEPEMPNKELFPGKWREKVFQSDIGIAAVLGGLFAWASCNGIGEVMALYGGPLLVVNAWLVTYTWLQHTEVDVPHFDKDNHNFVKGALHTIDRPYDKLDPWGAIDFLHHKIGTTHVAHHFDSTIPHYKAQAATDAIKNAFPQLYLYEDTPIPQAMWRLARGCTAVVKRGDRWVWDNTNLEEKL